MIWHSFLIRRPPETAHTLAVAALRLMQWGARILDRFRGRSAFDGGRVILLPVASGMVFRGRVGLAAGFDKNAECYAGLLRLGFGFVEVGTVTPRPQPGNPAPRIWRVGHQGLINHLGFNSVGLDIFLRNVRRYRQHTPKGALLANIGKNKDTPEENALSDYALCFQALKTEVDAFVVNLSSPNTPALRDLQSERFLEKLAAIAPRGMPVLIKLAGDLDDTRLMALCSWICCESRLAGVVVTNTSRAIAEEKFGRSVGGYSGPLLFGRALECVGLARRALGPKKVLIAVGGIDSLASAEKMRNAGADFVEIYTSFIYQGPRLVKELSQLR